MKPHLRRKGIGLALLKRLAAIARERDYGRMEWSVLDWNTPAINFYKKLGAVPLDDWTMFRLTGDALANFSRALKYWYRARIQRRPGADRSRAEPRCARVPRRPAYPSCRLVFFGQPAHARRATGGFRLAADRRRSGDAADRGTTRARCRSAAGGREQMTRAIFSSPCFRRRRARNCSAPSRSTCVSAAKASGDFARTSITSAAPSRAASACFPKKSPRSNRCTCLRRCAGSRRRVRGSF